MQNTMNYRKFALPKSLAGGPATLDEASRSVEVICATENPVQVYDWERGVINEVLLMSGLELPGNGQLPLLDSHSRYSTSAVVGSVRSLQIVGGQLIGRALFSHSPEVDPLWTRVSEGHLTDFSVGYRVIESVWVPEGQKQKIGGRTYQGPVKVATKWQAKELSTVAIGADPSAKARGEGDFNMDHIELNGHIESNEQHKRPRQIRREAERQAREEVQEILALGETHNLRKEASQAISNGWSAERFRGYVLEAMQERHSAQPVVTGHGDLGLTPKEQERFSFMKAIRFLADPGNQKLREAATFEIEVSGAYEDKSHRAARGLLIPPEVLRHEMKRDMSTLTMAGGGALVADDLKSGSFIDALENAMVVKQLGCIVLRDLVGNVSIPKKAAGGTAYWIGEGEDITESQPSLGQVKMSPMGIGAYTDLTRKFILQSSIDAEAFVRNDLALQLAIAVDAAAIAGTGAAGEPLGILNTTGIGTKTLTTANTPTFAECVDIETEISIDNALVGSLAYTANATIAGNMKQTDKGTDTGKYVLEGGKVNGYKFLMSNQVTAKYILFGNWRDLILGYWSGIDVNVDTASLSKSGGVRVVVMQDVDVAVRHPESFAYGYKA